MSDIRSRLKLFLLIAVAAGLLLSGTLVWRAPVDASPSSSTTLGSVVIDHVPHVKQKDDFCGEACVAMYLQRLGRNLDQDYVFDQANLDPALGRGCYTRDLAVAIKNIGFRPGKIWYTVNRASANKELTALFSELCGDLEKGIPSIVCMHYNDQPNTTEHFRLVLGFDNETDEIIYHEPAVQNGAYQRMKRSLFIKLWPLKYEQDRWTVVRFKLEPSQIRNDAVAQRLTNADYAQHVMSLRKRLPNKDFKIVIQPPFVVVGDESLATLKSRGEKTVKWSVDRLKQRYFEREPDHVIEIWLFKDKDSYYTNATNLFGSKPTTPYGYYSPSHKALVMNISTGGGTLVHEIVHPFIAANFPGCPSWFNEGLASLYEQCGDRGGVIWGQTNWRLRGLQIAIQGDRLPTFKELCSTTTREFYDDPHGTNYAQARYLCYYLQERGQLVEFYQKFRKNVRQDPTGYKTLATVLSTDDMEKFQTAWEKYIMGLRF